MTTASDLADELERAEDFLNDPNKFAISRRLRDRILSALRRVEVMEKALELLHGDHEIKPMLEARLDRLLDHHEHFRAVGGPNDSATFQWSDQVALLHEAVLAFRARQALTGEA
jgi:hypothetical protein